MTSNETPMDQLSLEQLDGEKWGSPPADASRMMSTVYELRHKPVGGLEPEELRVLLSQQVGVDVLMPRALRLLAANPLLEGDHYPGDVLVALLKAPAEYWSAHPDHLAMVREILGRVDDGDVDQFTRGDIENFKAKTSGLA